MMILIYTAYTIKVILSPFLHFSFCFEEKNKQLTSLSFFHFITFKHSHNKFATANLLLQGMQALPCHCFEYPH